MSDIYNILSKHFTGEAIPQEELQAQQFKKENPKEYQALHAFWTKKGLEVSEFNTSKAWQQVAQKAKPAKRIPMYSYIRTAASVAAIFLVTMLGYYHFNTANTPVEQMAITAKERIEKVDLADGSTVYLKKDATLKFPTSFASNNREVILQGEAFFEVAKDASRPFRIFTRHSEVEVLGTSFNIDTEAGQTEVIVTTGKVQVTALSDGKSALLTPSQSVLIKDHSFETSTISNNNYIAWKTGIFDFEKATLSQIVEELNSFYENTLSLSNTDSDCLFTTSFKEMELEEILEVIQLSCSIKTRKKNNSYELY